MGREQIDSDAQTSDTTERGGSAMEITPTATTATATAAADTAAPTEAFFASLKAAASAALPIMLGYVAIGIPCGILSSSIGLNALQAFMLSVLFYSGAGQFMIPNMWLAGASIASIIASVSLVNTRQVLYSASFAPVCRDASRPLAFLFAASVTDESYGVNTQKFQEGNWSVEKALLVNVLSCLSWSISNALGVLLAGAISIPVAIASFAMTSIFICLLFTQKLEAENMVAAAFAALGVFVCKCVGLSGAAILIGALVGVASAVVFSKVRGKGEKGRKCGKGSDGGNGEKGRVGGNGEKGSAN